MVFDRLQESAGVRVVRDIKTRNLAEMCRETHKLAKNHNILAKNHKSFIRETTYTLGSRHKGNYVYCRQRPRLTRFPKVTRLRGGWRRWA